MQKRKKKWKYQVLFKGLSFYIFSFFFINLLNLLSEIASKFKSMIDDRVNGR